MRGSSILREAAAALSFNRQRSLLTMASLGWGVACFVILYSYGEGFGFALRSSLWQNSRQAECLSHSACRVLILRGGTAVSPVVPESAKRPDNER